MTSVYPLYSIEDRIRSFWRYVYAREQVYDRRVSGNPYPWTSDPILDKYHFANVRRLDDPGTKYFLDHVTEQGLPPDQVLSASVAYRFVNRIETFQKFGWPNVRSFIDSAHWTSQLIQAHAEGQTILTGRYFSSVQRLETALAWTVFKSIDLMDELNSLPDPEDGQALQSVIRKIPFVGHFMSTQILADLAIVNGTGVLKTVVPALGPGSKSAVHYMAHGKWANQTRKRLDLQESLILDQLNLRREIDGPSGLTPIDVEHNLCEWSKYLRLAQGHPVQAQLYVRTDTHSK